MATTFSKKSIELEITLGSGDFGGGNAKTIKGLACDVTITKPGLPDKNSANVTIWGLKYEDMAQLTMLAFRPLDLEKNYIKISAGEEGEAMSVAFEGEISSSYADFNSSPDVAMKIEANSGIYPQLKAEPPLSIQGEATAAQLIEQQAGLMGYSFKNEGVSSSVKNAVFNGSPVSKAQDIADQVGADLLIDDGMVILMPRDQARSGNAVLLTPETGLIGYPTFNQDGIVCRCFYDPELKHFGLIKVKSIVPKASGAWKITKLTHKLSAYKPSGGPWESEIEAIDV